jgi:hypothetical protein
LELEQTRIGGQVNNNLKKFGSLKVLKKLIFCDLCKLSLFFLFPLVNSCRARKSFSSEKEYIIQAVPGEVKKRVYWLESNLPHPRNLCSCTSDSAIVGNYIPKLNCGTNTKSCAQFDLFNEKFNLLSDPKRLISGFESTLKLSSLKQEELKAQLIAIESDVKDPQNSANKLQSDKLTELQTNTKILQQRETDRSTTVGAELAFVQAHVSDLKIAVGRLERELQTEGTGFNLGGWSKTEPNVNMLSFVSKLVYEAHEEAKLQEKIPSSATGQLPLSEALKTFVFQFSSQKPIFHSTQSIFFPSKEMNSFFWKEPKILGPFAFKWIQHEEVDSNDGSQGILKSALMGRRGCNLFKTNPDVGKNSSDVYEFKPPFTLIENISSEVPSAAFWDQDQAPAIVSCGFVSGISFGENTLYEAHKNDKKSGYSAGKKNISNIHFDSSTAHGDEKIQFTVSDFLEIMPQSRILHFKAKK